MDPDMTCSIDGCDRPVRARGWCKMHYSRWQTHGDPLKTLRLNGEAAFWPKVDKTGPCWFWTAALDKSGYGVFGGPGHRRVFAHRAAYEFVVGPIPDGLELDHLCRLRHCVNPAHLEPVTHAENVRRGAAGAWGRSKVACPSGHEYSPENTYIWRGVRLCRECRRIRKKKPVGTGRPSTTWVLT